MYWYTEFRLQGFGLTLPPSKALFKAARIQTMRKNYHRLIDQVEHLFANM